MSSENVEISELFNLHRLPDGFSLFFLLFYAPIGLLLVVVRVFFSLQLMLMSFILPKDSFVRSLDKMCACNDFFLDQIVVCNNITHLDNVAMEIAVPSIMYEYMSPSPWLINKVLGYTTFGGTKEKENLNSRVTQLLTEIDVPLLVFPEESTTNGQKGVLKFNPWCFELYRTITPVTLEVKRPSFPDITKSTLSSSWCSDLFWFFFVPYTQFHIRFLPRMDRNHDQSVEEFSQEVQKAIATSLHLSATEFTAQDKNAYIKHLQQQQEEEAARQARQATAPPTLSRHTSSPYPAPSRDTRLLRMAQQVREVLPQVPIDVIQRDLSKSRCVDTTISNILEGRVPYTPEKPPQSATSSTSATPEESDDRRSQKEESDDRRSQKEVHGEAWSLMYHPHTITYTCNMTLVIFISERKSMISSETQGVEFTGARTRRDKADGGGGYIHT
ncbi:predicted protein [Nematostella vectensis]|uniref:Lipid droplet-regulating VLDL assembly factor AUP1 n=1 Tax=Nematostella vectensis TaxID=45351 RepID=A7SVC7_NEMVE|nr:predicted protein [Nematostella vectensis]|eukprot:XP_001624449.1 predicted protein [Nematostella vectensis]